MSLDALKMKAMAVAVDRERARHEAHYPVYIQPPYADLVRAMNPPVTIKCR